VPHEQTMFTLVTPMTNMGVAWGWNELLRQTGFLPSRSASAAPSDAGVPPWVLLMNADIKIRCEDLHDFILESAALSDRNIKLASRSARPALRDDAPYDTCPRYTESGLTPPAIVSRPLNDDTAAVAIHHLHGFAAFAVYPDAVRAVGGFDENIWPAYGEDLEMALRLRADGRFTRVFYGRTLQSPMGCTEHADWCGVVHATSTVKRNDPAFPAMLQRWGRGEYNYRKWGYDRREHDGMAPQFCPYPSPFNLSFPGANASLLQDEPAGPRREGGRRGAGDRPGAANRPVPMNFATDVVLDPAHRGCIAHKDKESADDGPFYIPAARRAVRAASRGGADDAAAPCHHLCLQRFHVLIGDASSVDPATLQRLTTDRCHGVPNF
jgi:hypothetical protein